MHLYYRSQGGIHTRNAKMEDFFSSDILGRFYELQCVD